MDIIILLMVKTLSIIFPVNPLFEPEVRHAILSVLGITGSMHACMHACHD